MTEFISALEDALNSTESNLYSVSYSYLTMKITITGESSFFWNGLIQLIIWLIQLVILMV
jgi:hypothetical protein